MKQLPNDTSELKRKIERLARERRWSEIRAELADCGDGELGREPKIAYGLAEALIHLGESGRALTLSLAAEAAFRVRHDAANLMAALNLTGAIQFELGDLKGADERFASLLELARERDDPEMIGRASNNLGAIASLEGAYGQALSLYRLAIPAYQQAGHKGGLAQTAHNLGITYRDLGNTHEARRQYEVAFKGARRVGDRRLAAMATTALADLFQRSGDQSYARRAADRALEEFLKVGDELGRADALRVLAAASIAQGDERSAGDFYEQALEIARTQENPLLEAEILEGRSALEAQVKQVPQARADLEAAAALYRRLGAAERLAKVEEKLARL